MADSMAHLVLRITAQNHTAGALAGVGRGLHGVSAQAIQAGALLAAGVAVGATAAVKSAAEFQRTMVQTAALTGQSATSIGASTQQMAAGFTGTSKQVLDAVGQTGQSAQDLGKALYFIASSGFPRATDAMKIMTVAGRDATITHSDATKAADVLTTALNSYGAGANQAALYNDILLQTLNLGKAEFPALASSLGTVLPVAAQVGMSFRDVGASIATMTLSGLSARKSTLDLNRLIQSVVKPTKGQQVMASALGIDMSKVDFSQPGAILAFLEMVKAKIASLPKGEQQAVLGKLFGNQAAIQGAQVLMQHATNLAHNIKEMSKASAEGTITNKAYAEVSKTLAVQWQTLVKTAGALAIQIGGRLSPIAFALIGILQRLVHGVQHLLGPVGHSSTALRHAQAASVGLGTALGLLVPTVITFVGASRAASLGLTLWAAATRVWRVATALATGQQIAMNIAMRANLIGIVITAIVALVVVIIYAWNHWKGFHTFVVAAWRFLAGTFGPALGTLGGILKGAFSAAWDLASKAAHGLWYVARILWQLFTTNVLPIIKAVAGALAGPFIQAWKDGAARVRLLWTLLTAFWTFLSTTFDIKKIGQGIKDALVGAFDAAQKKIVEFVSHLSGVLKVLAHMPGMEWVGPALATLHALQHAKHMVDTHDARQRHAQQQARDHGSAVTAGLLSNAIYGSGGTGEGQPVVQHKHDHTHSTLTTAQHRTVEQVLHGAGGAGRSPATDIARDFSTALGYYQASAGLDSADVKRMQADIARMATSDPVRAAKLQQQLDVAVQRRHEAIRHQGAVEAHHRQVTAQRAVHHAQVVAHHNAAVAHHNQVVAHQAALRRANADAATLLRTIHTEIREHRFAQAARDITRYAKLVQTADHLKGLDPARAKADADARARALTDDLRKARETQAARPTFAPPSPVARYGGLAGETGYGGVTVSFGGAQANPWQAMLAKMTEMMNYWKARALNDEKVAVATQQTADHTKLINTGIGDLVREVHTPPPPQPATSVNSHLKARGTFPHMGRV